MSNPQDKYFLEYGLNAASQLAAVGSNLPIPPLGTIVRLSLMQYWGILNIPENHMNGFLDVTLKNGGGASLALCTRVRNITTYEDTTTNRIKYRFIILDYPHINEEASVYTHSSKSRLGLIQYNPPAIIRFDNVNKTLTIDGLPGVKITAGSSPDKSEDKLPVLPNGSYKVFLPTIHDTRTDYLKYTPYAKVWFQIKDKYEGTGKGRYLHAGKVSYSCITCGETDAGGDNDDLKTWTTIHNYLIKCRDGNKYVGTVYVV